MYKNVLQVLENTAKKYPNKIAFGDSKREINYQDFVTESKIIGTYIAQKVEKTKQPIVIFIDKSINCLESMMGVLYSGNFYTIIDVNSPIERIKSIINTLKPSLMIIDNKNLSKFKRLDTKIDTPIEIFEEALKTEINEKTLNTIREYQIDTDIMYVLFTSGSTGTPKGTVINHKAVLSYISWVVNEFKIDENTIFGSQTPFYFSMSVTDVFSTIATGATLHIIPKIYFSFPIKLIEFMNNKKINTIYWVPSALCLVANFGALEDAELPYLKKVLFAGEVMPVKQLNIWIEKFPKCLYANLYGPTETTDICSFYVVNRHFNNNETLPIGKHCDNCNLIIVKENGEEAKENEQGELLVRGSILALGYYGDNEKTSKVFIQNPLNSKYPEMVYKTGDIVKYNEKGELLYLSRKDYQIKHMGYRIELGEIEKSIYVINNIILCACVYDQQNQKIVLFYQGNVIEEEVAKEANKLLLPYMRPNQYIKLDRMPYNSNGKIDRKKLLQLI